MAVFRRFGARVGEHRLSVPPENLSAPFVRCVAKNQHLQSVAAVEPLDSVDQAGGKTAFHGQPFEQPANGVGIRTLYMKGRSVLRKNGEQSRRGYEHTGRR